MKIHTLLIAMALVGGNALAQAPDAQTTPGATAQADKPPAKTQEKVHQKKSAAPHASAHSQGTASMGAGIASPDTDLNAGDRQQRMDQAYSDWQAKAR